MQVIEGISACGGVSIGTAAVLRDCAVQVESAPAEDAARELARVEEARVTAKAQLEELRVQALEQVGEEDAAIFEVHQMMLDDLDYVEGIQGMINDQQASAEYAVQETGAQFAAFFASLDDDYMRARSADVRDISDRLIRILQGVSEGGLPGDGPVVVLADDLTPSQTVQMDKSRVLAFVTRKGSVNSHAAILARTLGIPSLVGVDFADDAEGAQVVVDGEAGKLVVNPDPATLADYEVRQAELAQARALLQEMRGKESVTSSGQRVSVFANIGGVSDAELAAENDADGIGLFRTEFLFLESEDFPSEETQFQAYKAVAQIMGERKVVIRTLDIGADKQVPYFPQDPEENPALGNRAVRLCLEHPSVFKTQLRALLRASVFGNLAIMFPLIIAVSEVRACKELVAQVRAELEAEGVEVGSVELGIMVETPAAALIADELAQEVDFFSIGTNDLTQYTLAIDRQNTKLTALNDVRHPAVMRLLQMVADAGHAHDCWVGICGELAADTSLTADFARMGFDELSVSPASVLQVRAAVREV